MAGNAASRAQRAIGLELDGSRATAVSVTDRVVEGTSTAVSDSPGQAIREALAPFNSTYPVRVTISSPATKTHIVDFTKDLMPRSAFTAEAARLLGDSPGYDYSGLVHDAAAAKAGRLTPALAVGLPSELVSLAYAALASLSRTGEVVAAPAVAPEGLTLAVRSWVVDLTLVVDSQAYAFEVLAAPGLDALIASLGGRHAKARVHAALSGDLSDPLASAEVARWANSIASQAETVTSHWRSLGLSVPADIQAYGPGATTHVASAFAARRMKVVTPDVVKSLSSIDQEDRGLYAGALLAAGSYSRGLPGAAFLSQNQIASAKRKALVASSRSVAVTAVAASVLLLLPVVVPLTVASAREFLIDRQATSLVAEIAQTPTGALGVYSADSLNSSLSAPSNYLSATTSAALAATEAGLVVSSIESEPLDLSKPPAPVKVRVSALVPDAVQRYSVSLAALLPGYTVVLDSFDSNNGSIDATLLVYGPVEEA